jgi:hypothetical protein
MPDLPLEDVLLILRGWKDEKRLIAFQLGDVGADVVLFAFGFGAIEELTPSFLRIDSRTVNSLETGQGQQYGCTASLQRAEWFALRDWRNVSPQEESMKKVLEESYDLILTVAFGRTRLVLHTFRAAEADGARAHGAS